MHGLEVQTVDGVKFATFASYRKPGWHGLGTVFEEPKTSEEILVAAKLDSWNVHVKQVQLYLGDRADGSPQVYDMPNDFAVFRNNPFNGQVEPFGMVKGRYTPVQNEEIFALGDAIIGDGDDACWETAGSIHKGKVVFGVIKFQKQTLIGQTDKIDQYLMVTQGLVGNLPVIAQVTPVRTECANTWSMAMANYSSRVSFRHTASISKNLQVAQDALHRAHKYFEIIGKVGNALIDIPVDGKTYHKWIDELYPKPEEDLVMIVRPDGEPEEKVINQRSITLWENRRDTLVDVWNEKTDRGETLGEARNTAWGAINAITETIDWHGRNNDGSQTGLLRAAGFNDTANDKKQEALDFVAEKADIKIEELVLA